MGSGYQQAASAAANRAAQCHQRALEVAARRPVARDDVQRAQTALINAAIRAAAAELRLEGAASARCPSSDAHVAGSGTTPTRVRDEIGALRAAASGRDLTELFVAYFALGGQVSPFELDAFIHGALDLPQRDRATLQHAIWEMDEFR